MVDSSSVSETPPLASQQSLFVMGESEDENETSLRSETLSSEPRASTPASNSNTSWDKPSDAATTSTRRHAAASDAASMLPKRSSFTSSKPAQVTFETPRTDEPLSIHTSFENPTNASSSLSSPPSRTTSADATQQIRSNIAIARPDTATSEAYPNKTIPAFGLNISKQPSRSPSSPQYLVPSDRSQNTPALQGKKDTSISAQWALPSPASTDPTLPPTSAFQHSRPASKTSTFFNNDANNQVLVDRDLSTGLSSKVTRPEKSTSFDQSKPPSSQFATEHDPRRPVLQPTSPTSLSRNPPSRLSEPQPISKTLPKYPFTDPQISQPPSSSAVSSACTDQTGSETPRKTVHYFPATLSSDVGGSSSAYEGTADPQPRTKSSTELQPTAWLSVDGNTIDPSNDALLPGRRPYFPGAFRYADSGSFDTEHDETLTHPSAQSPTFMSSRLDVREEHLDTLSKTITICEGGLLQQFVEHTIGSVIAKAVTKVDDEKSWRRASKTNSHL